MICREDFGERVILVGHNPEPVVFATTREHIGHLKTGDDGHYARDDLDRLVNDGQAARYENRALMDIVLALPNIIGGCPPRA